MTYGLPTRGQRDWDDELNNSVESLRSDAEAATAAAEQARSNATSAISIAQDAAAKVDAFRSIPDAATASLVTDGPLTSAALAATIAAAVLPAEETADAALQAATLARVEDAVSEWWTYPSGINIPTLQTIFFGAIAADGSILACATNYGGRKVQRIKVGQATVDDHNRPSLVVAETRRSIILWNNHNTDNVMHLRVGNVGTIDTWGPDQTSEWGAGLSYAQTHHVSSTATTDTYLVIARVYASAAFSWRSRKLMIDRETGSASWGPMRHLLSFTGNDQGYISSVPFTNATGNAGLRIGISLHPVNAERHHVYGLEVDLVTGAITSVVGSALASKNIYTGTGLPIAASTDLSPIVTVANPQATPTVDGNTARLLAVRPGPAEFAVAYAYWASATLLATYAIRERQYVGLVQTASATARASTPNFAGMNVAQVSVRIGVTFDNQDPGATAQVIARRWDSATNNRMWMFRLEDNGRLSIQWSTDGTATVLNQATALLPAGVKGVGFDFDPAGGTIAYYYTLDGVFWQTLSSGTVTATSIHAGASALEVGTSTGSLVAAPGRYRWIKVYDAIAGDPVLSMDFAKAFAEGSTSAVTPTAADDQAHTWTLFGTSTVTKYEWVTSTFGDPGDPIGSDPEAKYLGGMGFPNPAPSGDTVYVVREDAGVWTVERWTRQAGVWSSETIYTAETGSKLSRLEAPVGGGPYLALVTEFSHYGADWTDYAGDIVWLTGIGDADQA